MNLTVLVPLPRTDFDPSEVAIPWRTLVQTDVTAALAAPGDFLTGPRSLLRDSPENIERGFVVRDGNYLSGRWPGDVHRYSSEFLAMINE